MALTSKLESRPAVAPRSRFALIGLIIGALGLGSGIAHFFLGPITPSPSIEHIVADQAARIRDAAVARLSGQELVSAPNERRRDPDQIVQAGAALAGFTGLMLGLFGFIRREDYRTSGSAAAIGAAAIALQFFVAALGMVVLALLIVAALHALGGG